MIRGYQAEILSIYEDIRKKEQIALDSRKKEISIKVPRIIDIEKKVAKLSVELSINILKNDCNVENTLKSLREKITNLRVEKSELLVSNGYPVNYTDLHYRCTKCHDTGFIGNRKCSCYKQNLIKVLYEKSELKNILKTNNFENFNLMLFSSSKNINEPASPRKNIERIYLKSIDFINNFDKSDENLLFYGSSGTGKTFLSNCIAKELLDKGYLVVYRTSEDLLKDLKQIRFESDSQLEDLILNCDLLIIDDLGTEQINEFSKTELFNILNRKLLRKNKMLISTNYSIESLLKTYSERMSSRLMGNFTLHKFYGEDIRMHLNIKRKK